jgi:hypothetical protein
VQESQQSTFRIKAVTTKLTPAEVTRLKARAKAAGVHLSTFVRTVLLKSRLKGTRVPQLNQEGWALLSNLENEVRAALARPGGVDDISLGAFAADLAALRATLIGRSK